MICREKLEERLAELPLLGYFFLDPKELEFSDRVRQVCRQECPRYGKTWACPPAVGEVAECRGKCLGYENCLMIATVTEVEDLADMARTLATRAGHEAITEQVGALVEQLGAKPYILSTESCAVCEKCAYLEGKPCRHPERMHPCLESHGINLIPTLEENGIDFQFGGNTVTWLSLLFY